MCIASGSNCSASGSVCNKYEFLSNVCADTAALVADAAKSPMLYRRKSWLHRRLPHLHGRSPTLLKNAWTMNRKHTPLRATFVLPEQIPCAGHICHELFYFPTWIFVRLKRWVHPSEKDRCVFFNAIQAHQLQSCMVPFLDCAVAGHRV